MQAMDMNFINIVKCHLKDRIINNMRKGWVMRQENGTSQFKGIMGVEKGSSRRRLKSIYSRSLLTLARRSLRRWRVVGQVAKT